MKVEDYGDMLSKVTGLKLIAYHCFGSYQGDWIAALENGDSIELWKGYYGSCSSCDWLEAKVEYDADYESRSVSDADAKSYFKEDRPFAVIPKETVARVDTDTFEAMLPANTRKEIYDFDAKVLHDEIKISLNK